MKRKKGNEKEKERKSNIKGDKKKSFGKNNYLQSVPGLLTLPSIFQKLIAVALKLK